MPPSQPAPGLSMLQPGCACPTWATVGAEVLSGALSIQQRSGDETQLEGHLGSVPAAASRGHLHTSSARSQGRVLGQLAAGHGGSGKLPTETDGRLLAGVRGSSETPRRAPASWGGPGAGSTDNEIPDLRHVDCARQSDSGLPLARGQAGLSGCPPPAAGTEKVRQAQECGQLHVVNPDWLWSCLERWDRVEEQLFPLRADYGRAQR